jgi:adenosylhomocysteine nucleosidase
MHRATLVCFAMPPEARPFRKLSARRNDILVLITGVGQANARRAVEASLSRCKPELLLTCGFAGGLDPKLPVGTTVFDAAADFPLRTALMAAGARAARFHCADRIIATAADKALLREATSADAVEMESQTIRQLCTARALASATVRVISDGADEDLPLDFNRFFTSDQKMDYLKLFWEIGKHPGYVRALLRFQRQTQSAAQRLANTLVQVLR